MIIIYCMQKEVVVNIPCIIYLFKCVYGDRYKILILLRGLYRGGWSVLLVQETGVPGENHQSAAIH